MGEADNIPPSKDVVRQLHDKGFDFYLHTNDSKLDVSENGMSPSLKALRTEAKQRSESIVQSNLLGKICGRHLVPAPGIDDVPDRFITDCEMDGDKISIAVGELDMIFNIVFGKSKTLSQNDAKGIFVEWHDHLFKAITENVMCPLEIIELPEFWLVQQVLMNEQGNQRRYIPWTWPESVKMAIDKHGRWLSVSVKNLPASVSSMPAGFRGRSHGHWFDANVEQKRNAIK